MQYSLISIHKCNHKKNFKYILIILLALISTISIAQASSKSSTTSSRWYSDEDNDGIDNSIDNCIQAYNPSNIDKNKNGIGDACERPTVLQKGIKTLYAEAITEYGGWFKFISTQNSKYDNSYAVIFWSNNINKVNKTEKLNNILRKTNHCKSTREYIPDWIGNPNDSNCKIIRVIEDKNILRSKPVIIYDMEPDNTYYMTMRYLKGKKASPDSGNIIKIHTTPLIKPEWSNTKHPRIFATPALIKKWRSDKTIAFNEYKNDMRREISQAITGEDRSGRHQYCLPSATLFQMTDNENDLNSALELFSQIVLPRWQKNDYSGDSYRFQNENLTYCVDALWNQLSTAQRKAAATEAIKDAKKALSKRRFNDTDQFVSLVRSFLAVGFTYCKESKAIGIKLSNDACIILDEGYRRMFGGLLPMARKDLGRFGNSGGYLPDGASYEKGTMNYWINNFWILTNMGHDMSEYAPFIANNFLAGKIHSTTPSGRGYFAHGDVQNYYYSGRWLSGEPNTLNHQKYYNAIYLLQSALLKRMGEHNISNKIQKFVDHKNTKISNLDYLNYMLFKQHVDNTNYTSGLDTAFTDSGYGIIFDRTSWNTDATYTVFTAAWGGFDHNASDTGNLSIYRNQEWLFNHNTGYGGVSISPESHNVARYTTKVNNTNIPFMYPLEAGGDNEIKINYISDQLDYFVFDATNNYNSSFENAYYYEKVERAVIWFKNSITDDYIIIDYAKTNDTFPENNIELNINLPSVNGNYSSISTTQAELQTNSQKARISLTPATGTSAYTLHNQGGIPYNYNPFRSILYSNYLAYSLITPAPEIHNEIAIQITNINKKYDRIHSIDLESWRLKAIGDNLLLYPVGSLIDPSSPNIDKKITLPKKEYKKLIIIGLLPEKRYLIKLKEEKNVFSIVLNETHKNKTKEAHISNAYGIITINNPSKSLK